MHIGSQMVDIDPNREADRNPSLGLGAMTPPQFPNAEAEMEWRADSQRAIDCQGVPFAIAPRCEIVAPLSGRRLTAGCEVVQNVDATVGQILTLERRGVVLRGTPEGMRAAAGLASDSRYVVSPNQAISSLEGQLLAGAAVDATMLEGGEQALLALVHRGVVRDRNRPALSQAPADVALREREVEREAARVAVQAARNVLAGRDDAKTQKAYVEAKLQLDLADVRVELAHEAAAAAQAAEVERQRAELARQIDELATEIKKRESDQSLRAAELKATAKLANALAATHEHADGTYQLQIRRNARYAELHGGDVREENMPGTRYHAQIRALAQLTETSERALLEPIK